MLKKEWPLAVFTVLAQAGAGAFLFLAFPFVFSKNQAGGMSPLYLNVWTLCGTAALVAAGSAVSFFHLGSPFRAVNALNNIGGSWLSREILAELVFLGAVALMAFLSWRGRPGLLKGLAVIAAVSGLTLVYSMSRIYMLDIVPAWRSVFTPFSFFGTSVLLGGITAVCAVRRIPLGEMHLGRLENPARMVQEFSSFQHAALVAAVAAVVAVVLTMFAFTPGVGVFAVKKVTLLDLPASKIRPVIALRLALLTASAAILIKGLSRGAAGGAAVDDLLLAALLCSLAAELVGRFLFYALYSRLGV